ncbi:MAG: hypothetical protein ACD_5C00130G0001 [uncultured bacterium]|nr:MAG: hypothetical protein ACD_5C00130G0001 [uncultured bacterium]
MKNINYWRLSIWLALILTAALTYYVNHTVWVNTPDWAKNYNSISLIVYISLLASIVWEYKDEYPT